MWILSKKPEARICSGHGSHERKERASDSAQGPANALTDERRRKLRTGSAEVEKVVTEQNHTKDFEQRAMQEGMEWKRYDAFGTSTWSSITKLDSMPESTPGNATQANPTIEDTA